jgi:hypothetical protein
LAKIHKKSLSDIHIKAEYAITVRRLDIIAGSYIK